MWRRLLGISQRAAVVGSLATGLYVAVLAFPEPLFSHELRSDRVTVYSRRPLEHDLLRWVDSSLHRLEGSAIDDPTVGFRIFELASPSWNRFFNGPHARSMARHSELGGNIFVPSFDVPAGSIRHFDGRSGPIIAILAHEMTHRLMQHRLGVLATLRLPWWKREGYAEFVAEGDTVVLAKRVAALDSHVPPADLPVPLQYLRALIATRYLFEVRRLDFAQFIATDAQLPELLARVRDERAR